MSAVAASPAHSPHFGAPSTSRSPLASPRGPPPPASATRDKAPSAARNHCRTNNSSRAIEQHKASVLRAQPVEALRPQRPPKPVRLATPSSGYPFPLMVTTPKEEVVPTLEPYRDARRPDAPQRKATPQGDGWDTPSSTAALSRASSAASRHSSNAPQRLAPLPGLTSAFSDCSSSASSSSCSTPLDSAPGSNAVSPFVLDVDDANPKVMRSPLAAPTTPAEVAHSRTKHAGSTPGAPPPAPLMHPHPPVAQQVLDLEDVRSNASSSSSPGGSQASSRAASPDRTPRKDRNPLVQGLGGLSMSAHSEREQPPGVGSKWEVD
ncbi:hypothetical protein JCM10450v2_002449 [Rhodotorula kratochvilovae]